MVVFGFAAAGKAGKATSEGAAEDNNDVDEKPGDRELGRGEDEGPEDGAESQAAVVRPAAAAAARADDDDTVGMAGNGLPAAALPQLFCLLTAEREDCAVELLSLRTR